MTLGCLFTSEAAKNGTKTSLEWPWKAFHFICRLPQRRQAIDSQQSVFTRMFRTSDFPPFYFTYVKLILEISFILHISGFV